MNRLLLSVLVIFVLANGLQAQDEAPVATDQSNFLRLEYQFSVPIRDDYETTDYLDGSESYHKSDQLKLTYIYAPIKQIRIGAGLGWQRIIRNGSSWNPFPSWTENDWRKNQWTIKVDYLSLHLEQQFVMQVGRVAGKFELGTAVHIPVVENSVFIRTFDDGSTVESEYSTTELPDDSNQTVFVGFGTEYALSKHFSLGLDVRLQANNAYSEARNPRYEEKWMKEFAFASGVYYRW